MQIKFDNENDIQRIINRTKIATLLDKRICKNGDKLELVDAKGKLIKSFQNSTIRSKGISIRWGGTFCNEQIGW